MASGSTWKYFKKRFFTSRINPEPAGELPGKPVQRNGWTKIGKERLWCSWSIQSLNRKLFIGGDSGYFDGFKQIGEELGPFDITLLEIGAYDEMWKQIHMTPEEAVQQHQNLGGSVMVPLHWATFDLGLHPWYEPIEQTLTAAKGTDVQIITPIIGEQVNIKRLPKVNPWWRNVDKHHE